MATGRAWPRGALVLAGIALAVAVVVRLHRLDLPLERDEGEYAYGARLILAGEFSYESLRTLKLPGVHLATALFFALFGETVQALRAALLAFDVGSALTLLFLARGFVGPWVAAWAAGTLALLQTSLTFLGLFAHAESFALFPALLGILLAVRAARDGGLATWAASGLAFGAAFLMKQPAVLFAALGAAGALAAARRDGARTLPARLAALGLGAALPFALVCAWMAAIGGFGAFWFTTVTYARAYTSDATLAQGLAAVGDQFAAWWHFQGAFVALAAVGALGFFLRAELRPHLPALGALLVAGAAATSVGLYFRTHYFVFVLPAIALLCAAGAASLSGWLGRSDRARGAILVGTLALAATLGARAERESLWTGDPATVTARLYHPNPTGEIAPLIDWIRAHSRPEDTIAVLGSEPQIPFLADRRSATGYVYMYPLFERHEHARAMHGRAIADIEAADPAFVVLVNVSSSWLQRTGSDTRILDWWAGEARERWRLDAVLDLSQPFRPVWITGDAARAHRPAGRSWISLFARRS